MEVTADDGRIGLPESILERYGEIFELVDRGDRLLLLPVPEDPLAELRKEWSDLDTSVEELRESVREGRPAETKEE